MSNSATVPSQKGHAHSHTQSQVGTESYTWPNFLHPKPGRGTWSQQTPRSRQTPQCLLHALQPFYSTHTNVRHTRGREATLAPVSDSQVSGCQQPLVNGEPELLFRVDRCYGDGCQLCRSGRATSRGRVWVVHCPGLSQATGSAFPEKAEDRGKGSRPVKLCCRKKQHLLQRINREFWLGREPHGAHDYHVSILCWASYMEDFILTT